MPATISQNTWNHYFRNEEEIPTPRFEDFKVAFIEALGLRDTVENGDMAAIAWDFTLFHGTSFIKGDNVNDDDFEFCRWTTERSKKFHSLLPLNWAFIWAANNYIYALHFDIVAEDLVDDKGEVTSIVSAENVGPHLKHNCFDISTCADIRAMISGHMDADFLTIQTDDETGEMTMNQTASGVHVPNMIPFNSVVAITMEHCENLAEFALSQYLFRRIQAINFVPGPVPGSMDSSTDCGESDDESVFETAVQKEESVDDKDPSKSEKEDCPVKEEVMSPEIKQETKN